MPIRWLHLSDVHESFHEGIHRRQAYGEIIREVERREPPHLVFLTGDLAFSGTREEYASLQEQFVGPLKKILPDDCPLFTVPGNHDVDRKRSSRPRVWFQDGKERELFQSIGAAGAQHRRDLLLPRFEAYAELDRAVSAWGSDWLRSDAGSVWWSGDIAGMRIAIVGINTAWLCQDDDDWGKLTPGRHMLDVALDNARRTDPELLIVLGHHPLNALEGEGDASDGQRVRQRLEQANALYLHGHRHATGTTHVGDALRSTLAIQAPSAFQAHDDKRWRNGLMWGSADLASGWLVLEPRLWNEDLREYKWDVGGGYNADRAPGREGFRLRLPGWSASHVVSPESAAGPANLPPGWEFIDRAVLDRLRATPPSPSMMTAFFDGVMPTWSLVLAPGMQPRAIVERLASTLRAAHGGAPRPKVTLLTGPGGEGKSTVLLHTAAILVADEQQSWTCLHRLAAAASLPDDLFSHLPQKAGHAWVVVIDDADTVAAAILAALKQLGARTDVHLLLAARDTDWRWQGLVPGLWQPWADFRIEHLIGLDLGDARRIVAGWKACGDQGVLSNLDEAKAAKLLFDHAHDFAARQEQGALLGALLITRKGEDMRAHVGAMLHGLGRNVVIGRFSMRNIYAMVAAMHAENQLYLSRGVLSYALGCRGEQLEKALEMLRREALLDPGETYILTRHRRIAEAACLVLREDDEPVERWYPLLAGAAIRYMRANRADVIHFSDWCFGLANHFVIRGAGRWAVAHAVARALLDADPDRNDHRRVTFYSSVLRRTGQAAEALHVLRASGERFRMHREFLYEWATASGVAQEFSLDAWLSGCSIADGATPLRANDCKLSLAGLGSAFGRLAAQRDGAIFAGAQAACGELGLRLRDLDSRARAIFTDHVANGRRNQVAALSISSMVDLVGKAVIRAARDVGPEHDMIFLERILGDPDDYRYNELLRLIGGVQAKSGSRASGPTGPRPAAGPGSPKRG